MVEQQRTVFENSDQAVYVYRDDVHKFCNAHLGSMLGYNSLSQWSKVGQLFTQALVSANQDSIWSLRGHRLKGTWKTRPGRRVSTQVILVPVAFCGEIVALPFIS